MTGTDHKQNQEKTDLKEESEGGGEREGETLTYLRCNILHL